MTGSAKLRLYAAARQIGLFSLARRISSRRLRILAYHAFQEGPEVCFKPKLFITAATFARRLEIIARMGFRVVPLDDAVHCLRTGTLPHDCLVITIDDGFASTLSIAAPILVAHGFPSTVYLTSYHMEKQTPVFDLIVSYLIWLCPAPSFKFDGGGLWPEKTWDRSTPAALTRTTDRLVANGHALTSEPLRVAYTRALATATGMDYEAVESSGAFRLMTGAEAQKLASLGMSIGLHTHRHRFPVGDPAVCRRELRENADWLEKHVGIRPRHFCYPSGVYDARQWPLLQEEGILSSTTCDTGLVGSGDNPHGLSRFLDGEMVSDLEFEAELCGFSDLLRTMARGKLHDQKRKRPPY